MILPLLSLAYLVRADVSVLAIGGASSAEITATAKKPECAGWALDRTVWYVTTTKPTGYTAPSAASVQAAYDSKPALRFDPNRQTGYVRETAGGIPVYGDVSKGWDIRWRRVLTVYPMPTLQDAQDVVSAVYTLNRPLGTAEKAAIGAAGWNWNGDPNDTWRTLLKQARWEYLDSVGTILPPAVTTTVPALPAVPYDAADVVPVGVPAQQYQGP